MDQEGNLRKVVEAAVAKGLAAAIAAERERCAQKLQQWIDANGASHHGRDLNTLLADIRRGE
jgi:hypothetical protein